MNENMLVIINCTSYHGEKPDELLLKIQDKLYIAIRPNGSLPTGINFKDSNSSSSEEGNSTELNIYLMISANWNATVTHIQCCYNNASCCRESYSLLRPEIGGKDTHYVVLKHSILSLEKRGSRT